jgi:mono/diheme cytochrome c family protein
MNSNNWKTLCGMPEFSIDTPIRKFYTQTCLVIVAALSLASCDSGSLGSNVGSQESFPPVAEAVIVGHPNIGGGSNVSTSVRSGSEVTIAAGNSYGVDGPIVKFDWSAANAEAEALVAANELIVRNTFARSFTAPNIAVPTTYDFQLTVTDAEGDTDTATVSVTVEPAIDPDRFLQYLSQQDKFRVVPGTSQAIAADLAFTVATSLRVTYEDRASASRTWSSEPQTRSGAWLATLGTARDPVFFGNPSLLFDIPSLDLDDVNAAFVNLPAEDPGRQQILDAYKLAAPTTIVEVVIEFDFSPPAAGDAAQVELFVRDAFGDPLTDTTTMTAFAATVGVAEPMFVLPLTAFASQTVIGTGVPSESTETAELYYQTVDPDNERPTLNDWLVQNCFSTDLQSEYGADAHAVYVNNFDLGFGRDMYLKRGDTCSTGELIDGDLAYVVVNYPTLLGAAKRIDPIIAVAMEYSAPIQDPAAPRFAKFYVYTPNDAGDMVRVNSANFDGRGEKSLPGVCASCHGGRPKPIPLQATEYPDFGDIGSIFMPFDVDSFLFTGPEGNAQKDPALPSLNQPLLSDIDRNILETYTRSAQEDALRELNAAALTTYVPADQHAPVRALVHGWYGNAAMDPTSNDISGNFNSGTVPAGWTDSTAQSAPGVPVPFVANVPQPSEIYLGVVAQHCRACHTQQVEVDPASGESGQVFPTLDTYEDFFSSAGRTESRVYRQGRMPLARLTMDRFWVDFGGGSVSASDLLAAHLDEYSPPTSPRRPLGVPFADIAQTSPEALLCEDGETLPPVQRGSDVRLSGLSSIYADSYAWTINSPVNSDAAILGTETPEIRFSTDTFGDWVASLVVTSSSGAISEARTCTISVENKLPMPPMPPAKVVIASISEGGTTASVDVAATLLAAGGIEVFGDLPATISIGGTTNGTVSVTNNNSSNPTAVFTSTALAAQGDGLIAYSITDVDNDTVAGVLTVGISALGRPAAEPDPIFVNATSSVVPVSNVQFNVLSNDNMGGTGVVDITAVNGLINFPVTVRNSSGIAKGTVSPTANQQALLFSPILGQTTFGEAPFTFTYTITDQNPVQPQISTTAVTVTINPTVGFSVRTPTVQSAFSMASCLGCHAPAPIGNGSLPNLQNYAATTGLSQFQGAGNNKNLVDPPSTAGSSILLLVPVTDQHANGTPHTGFPGTLVAAPPSADYNVILRWIEEGANDN